jgi:hypothetical protein
LIDIHFTCDLCSKTIIVPSAVSDTVTSPKGWCTRGKTNNSFKEHYGKTPPAANWCSMAHRTAHLEAEEAAITLATAKGREIARKTFAIELKKLCLAAYSAVEALGNVIKEDE